MFSPSQIAHQFDNIITSLEAIIPPVSAVEPMLPALAAVKVSDAVIEDLLALLNDCQLAANALAHTGEGDDSGIAIVDRIGADLNAVLATLATLPLPPQAVLPIRIATMLVPIALAACHLIWPPPAQPQQAIATA